MLNPIRTINKLKILELNVNSIISLQRRHELNRIIIQHNPDIFLLNETHLNNRHKINFKNYTLIKRDSLTKDSGTAILVKSNIKIEIINIKHNFENLETVIIKVSLTQDKSVYCLSIYVNPNRSIHMPDFESLFKVLDLKNNSYIIGGDFNCRHQFLNDTIANSFGNKFTQWYFQNYSDYNITILNSDKPTYKNISYLDFFLISSDLIDGPLKKQKIETHPTFSDHNMIETTIDFRSTTHKILLSEP